MNPVLLIALLALHVAVAEWLERNTPLRHLGTALLVILMMAVSANLGFVPTYSGGNVVYSGIFQYVAPIAIFWLLLKVHLADVWRAGRSAISLFLLGSLGTFAGVMGGMLIVGGPSVFGERGFALGGMFVGTYTGGSINFNAVALEYQVMEDSVLYAGSAAVDNLMTTLWMATTLIVPRLLRGRRGAVVAPRSTATTETSLDAETVRPSHFAWLLFLGAGALWSSEWLEAWIDARFGVRVPSILLLTTMALMLAQVEPIRRLGGAGVLGLFAVYLFLAVIGSLCDLATLEQIGELAPVLALFVVVTVLVHGLVVFGGALLLRADPDVAAVASQANIGGGTSALALARSLGRQDLVLPAVLMGALGNALGTYLGFLAARLLS